MTFRCSLDLLSVEVVDLQATGIEQRAHCANAVYHPKLADGE